jgi:hypothetical protein
MRWQPPLWSGGLRSPRLANSGSRRSAPRDRGKDHKPSAKEVLLGIVVGRELMQLAAFLVQAKAPLLSALGVVPEAHGSDRAIIASRSWASRFFVDLSERIEAEYTDIKRISCVS